MSQQDLKAYYNPIQILLHGSPLAFLFSANREERLYAKQDLLKIWQMTRKGLKSTQEREVVYYAFCLPHILVFVFPGSSSSSRDSGDCCSQATGDDNGMERQFP